MIDWKIDCQTFLRLTGTALSEKGVREWGVYIIEPTGVRSSITPKIVARAPSSSTEHASLLDVIESTKLAFPTTSSKLVAWVEEQGCDFTLPEWFKSATQADSLKVARSILDKVKIAIGLQLDSLSRSPESRPIERLMKAEAIEVATSQLTVIEKFLAQCENGLPKQTRSNLLGEEIEAICARLSSKASTVAVMRELQSLAGKDGSSVVEKGKGFIIWKAAGGELDSLDMKNLKDRLRRRREKQTQSGLT